VEGGHEDIRSVGVGQGLPACLLQVGDVRFERVLRAVGVSGLDAHVDGVVLIADLFTIQKSHEHADGGGRGASLPTSEEMK
jgi:hypothetical protein